jgi:hypothetical protein
MDCKRCDSRIVRSVVVHDPHRWFMFVTHRTLTGCALPSRYAVDSWRARPSRALSPARGPVLANFASRRATRSTISVTSRRSSALLVRAGIKMMILSPSR